MTATRPMARIPLKAAVEVRDAMREMLKAAPHHLHGEPEATKALDEARSKIAYYAGALDYYIREATERTAAPMAEEPT